MRIRRFQHAKRLFKTACPLRFMLKMIERSPKHRTTSNEAASSIVRSRALPSRIVRGSMAGRRFRLHEGHSAFHRFHHGDPIALLGISQTVGSASAPTSRIRILGFSTFAICIPSSIIRCFGPASRLSDVPRQNNHKSDPDPYASPLPSKTNQNVALSSKLANSSQSRSYVRLNSARFSFSCGVCAPLASGTIVTISIPESSRRTRRIPYRHGWLPF